jgi:short-subunit dehydrogenase
MKKIFITGASSGIGKALATKLALPEHHLGLAARREDTLSDVANSIRNSCGKVEIFPLDVRDFQSQQDSISSFCNGGKLDIVIANAGFGLTKPILKTEPNEAREIFDTNFFGLMYTLQASAPFLKGGKFVGVSSVVTYALPSGYGIYSASKSAVNALLTTLRRETEGVFDVVLVNPGETETDFWNEAKRRSGELIPGKSPIPMATPEQVAETIVKSILNPHRHSEIFMSRFERFLPALRGAFPWILERHMRAT